MPTIEELFKSKKLASGKTAQEQYDIRNIKNNPITPYNSLLSLPFKGIQKLRQGTNKLKETRFEEETTGLRVISLVSTPVLYGTDTIKFTKKSRNIVDEMKIAANGTSDIGVLETFLNKAETTGKNLLSKIGVKLPEQLTPTRLANNKDFGIIGPLGEGAKPGGEYETMIRLAEIKNGSLGNFLGKTIESTLKGRPSVNQIIGSALDIGKKQLNKVLLGSGTEAAQNLVDQQGRYSSIATYSRTKLVANDDLLRRNDLSTKYAQGRIEVDNNTLPPYFPNVIERPNVYKNERYQKNKYSNKKNLEYKDTLEVKRGMTPKYDFLNNLAPYTSTDGLKPDDRDANEPTLESYDFIPLKFWSVFKKAAVNFRATITGLNETLNPEWAANKFVGNPFTFYTYNGIERELNFTFKIYALSDQELVTCWQKINFLTSLTYPQGYTANKLGVIPPFIKFTLGNMYTNKEAYINNMTYTVEDTYPWETRDDVMKEFLLPKIINVDITLKLVETVGSTYQFTEYEKEGNDIKYADADKKIPVVKTPAQGKRLYGFGAKNPSVVIPQDTKKQLDNSGAPLPKKDVSTQNTGGDNGKKSDPPAKLKPNPPEDPKGKLVTEYKGYKIYETVKGPFKTLTSYKGDAVFYKGDETPAAAQSVMIDIQKRYIDEKERTNFVTR